MIQGYFWNFVILKIYVNPFRTIDAIAAHGELLALMELGLQCIAENSRRRGLAKKEVIIKLNNKITFTNNLKSTYIIYVL